MFDEQPRPCRNPAPHAGHTSHWYHDTQGVHRVFCPGVTYHTARQFVADDGGVPDPAA